MTQREKEAVRRVNRKYAKIFGIFILLVLALPVLYETTRYFLSGLVYLPPSGEMVGLASEEISKLWMSIAM